MVTSAYFEAVAPLVKTWKTCRDAIYTGTILPIGEEPDGTAWTGMVSVVTDRKEAYLLLFREFNDRPTWSGRLPLWHGADQADILAGEGQVRFTGGRIEAHIDQPRRYVLVRLRA